MVVGRPLEFDRDRALHAAMREFWSHGYEATSLQSLLNAMNLSKSSLYQAFGSKLELFEKCLDRYLDEMVADLESRLRDSASPRRFIADTLNEIADSARRATSRDGCLVMNTASEFGQRDDRIAHCIARGTARVKAVLCKAVRKGQQAGEISDAKDAGALASYLLSSMAGLHTLVKAGTDAKSARAIAGIAMTALD